MIGFAIGNGLSRTGFDLESLRGKGPIVGCNRLYQDFSPDYIVALDSSMKHEINMLPSRDWVLISAVPRWSHYTLDGEPFCRYKELNGVHGRNSGITACGFLAKYHKVEKCYMIGFDFFTYEKGDKTNDVYHDRIIKFPNFQASWNLLFTRYPETEFIRVGPYLPWLDNLNGVTLNEHYIP